MKKVWTHRERKLLRYSPQQVYSVISDVAKYPQFLPWCEDAEILTQYEDGFDAKLAIGFRGLKEYYTSKVTLIENEMVATKMLDGPFDHIDSKWTIKPRPEGGCMVEFEVSFSLSSILLQKVLGLFFDRVAKKMVAAFEKRVGEVA